MGLAGYYRRFVEEFSKKANLITALQKKEKEAWMDREMHRRISKAQGAIKNNTNTKIP